MSPRVCIIGEPGGWHVGRLAEAVAARGGRVDLVRWRELETGVRCGPAVSPASLAAADVVVVRGMPAPEAPDNRLERVIFRMDALGELAAGGTPVVNPPRSLEIGIDKYLCLARLAAAGLPVPRTLVVQDATGARRGWERLGRDCVIKPLFGSRGRGLTRVTAPDAAGLAGDPQEGVVYLQEFVPHDGWDARLLVVGERVFAMRRDAAPGDWRTNIAVGGRPRPLAADPAWIDLARRATTAIGALVAGVDLLPAADGRVLILEVNAVPGWRALATVVDADVTAAIADHALAVSRA